MRYNILKINIPVLLLSFFMAFALWYIVVVGEQVEVQIEVQVEYKNVPEHLIITDGLIDSIEVRLRGPEALLRDIPLNSRVHIVDLADLHKGRNVIPFAYMRKKSLRAFDVQDIEPARMVVVADTMQERSVPVKVNIVSPLNSAKLKISDLNVTPSNVLVKGPSATVSSMHSVPLNVRISPNVEPGPQTQIEILDVPKANVGVVPSRVTVKYTVLSERKRITLEKPVQILAENPSHYIVKPDLMSMQVEVPEALEKNSGYLHGAQLSVAPPILDVNESSLVPLRVTLPEGMTLLESLPKVISLERVK